jgi:hypothetical protein
MKTKKNSINMSQIQILKRSMKSTVQKNSQRI